MTKLKKAKVIPVAIHRVRQPQTVKAGSQPRVVKMSASLKVGSNPPASIVSPLDDPMSAALRISRLGQSLSLAHDREQDLMHQNEALVKQKAALDSEVLRLTQFLQQKDLEHHNEIRQVKTKSHQEGISSAAKEMHTLWSSNEFAAELMYGELFDKGNLQI